MIMIPNDDQAVPTVPPVPPVPPAPPATDEVTAAWTRLADPALAPAELAGIAAAYPQLWVNVAWHPQAYPDLLDWLAQLGGDDVRTAVQQRREAAAALQASPATQATATATAPAVRSQRKALFKTLWLYILAFVTMQVVVPIIFLVVIMIVTIRSATSLEEQTQQVQDLLFGPWLPWMQLTAMVAGTCWFFVLRGRRLVTTDLTTTKPVAGRWGLIGKLAIAVLATQAGLYIITTLLYLAGIDLAAAQESGVDALLHSFIGVATITVIGPILEEIIFRGAILRHLEPYGVNFAIVTQALLFGIYHLNLYQGPFAFLMGLILGYVALRFSIKWAILLHIANNTMSVAVGDSEIAGVIYVVVIMLALVVAIIWAILARTQHLALIAEGRSTTIAHPFRTAWSHPLFIVVLAVGLILCTMISAFYA